MTAGTDRVQNSRLARHHLSDPTTSCEEPARPYEVPTRTAETTALVGFEPEPAARHRRFSRAQMLVFAALAVVFVIWGSTYVAISVAITTMPPMLMMAVRFAVAGALLLAYALWRKKDPTDPITWRQIGSATANGGLLLVCGTGLLTLSQTAISSGLAALLAATVPLFLALFARGVFGERLSIRAWIGLGVGLAGIGLLVDPRGGQIGAMLLALTGAAAWAAGSLRSRVSRGPRRPLVASALEMLGASVLFAIVGVVRGEHLGFDIAAVTTEGWFAFGYLVFAGSIVAYTAYRWLVANASTTLVGTHAYVNPVVAVALGWSLLGESITGQTLIAGAVVLVSVVLLVTGRPEAPVPAQMTSGGDVFAGASRWNRIKRRMGALPRAARLYQDPGVVQTRPTGYDHDLEEPRA